MWPPPRTVRTRPSEVLRASLGKRSTASTPSKMSAVESSSHGASLSFALFLSSSCESAARSGLLRPSNRLRVPFRSGRAPRRRTSTWGFR